MNITLSIDEKLLQAARATAARMGKSLNQLIREDLQRLTNSEANIAQFEQFKLLSNQGSSEKWQFNREDLHERT